MHTQHDKTDDPGQPAEVVLFRQAQTGDQESLNALMEKHDGLVHAVVRRQVLGDLPYAEALQAGRIGLWRAVVGFDPNRGYAFSTYAWSSIVHHVWRAVKAHTRAARVVRVGGWSTWQCTGSIDPAAIHHAWEVRSELAALIARLPARLRKILVTRYGLDGQRGCLYREIGAHLGVSGERVRQLHNRALLWLRHPAHSYVLRTLLMRHRAHDYEWEEEKRLRWLCKRGGRHGHS